METELDEMYESLKSIENVQEDEAIYISETIVNLSLLPDTKGDSKFKDAIISLIRYPEMMLMIVSIWNTRHSCKMIPNPIRRALKRVLETKFSQTELLQTKSFENIYLKDVIKLSRPIPFSVYIGYDVAEEMYNNGYTIYQQDSEMPINKSIIGVELSTLNLSGVLYHNDIFKMIIEKNI